MLNIKVAFVKANEPNIQLMKVDKNKLLDEFHKFIKYDWFEIIYVGEYILFINEEAKMDGTTKANIKFGEDYIFDDFFIVKDDHPNDSYKTLNKKDLAKIQSWLAKVKVLDKKLQKSLDPKNFIKFEFIAG